MHRGGMPLLQGQFGAGQSAQQDRLLRVLGQRVGEDLIRPLSRTGLQQRAGQCDRLLGIVVGKRGGHRNFLPRKYFANSS